MSKAKIVTSKMDISVVQDEKYNLFLQRGDGDPAQLFHVTEHGPEGYKSIHVLAESEEGAISQATSTSDKVSNSNYIFHAYRLPLLLRGWGNTAF